MNSITPKLSPGELNALLLGGFQHGLALPAAAIMSVNFLAIDQSYWLSVLQRSPTFLPEWVQGPAL